jgi:hypothetical protein
MYSLSKSIFFSTVFAFLVIVFVHAPIHAQTIPGIAEPVTFDVVPEYPKPNQTVTVSTQSFSTDLNKAIFKWSLNGKLYAQGTGMKSVSVKTGKAGSLTIISVEVSTPDFGIIKNDIAFRPAEVTLLWQSDTYVPALYEGKALHSYNGSFKVTAIPEFFDATGKRVNPKNLIYTWKKNGNVQGDVSGFGKDSFVTSQTSYLREGEDISVDVSSPKENLAGSASITVIPTVPEIVFYENSPLYGMLYEHAFKDKINLFSQEITLRAEPFYMSVTNPLNGVLTLDWKLNGASLPSFADKNEITLRKQANTSGESDVSLIVQNQKKLLQGASANIAIFQ